MSDWLLEWIAVYGVPALFVILVAAQAGVPLPMSLMLIIIGSLVEQGQLNLWQVVLLGTAGAVTGDLLGYFLGYFGGRPLMNRFADKTGGSDSVTKARDFSKKWGGFGIFFSRWLVTPLGPWLNLTSGVAEYPWMRFLIWAFLGELIWITLYVMIGRLFSDEVEYISDLLGNLTWVVFGLVVIGILAWNLRGMLGSSENVK